jgi:hypothetical protein
MNPSQPTTNDIRLIEGVFLDQMRALTRIASRNPARSFDLQCSEVGA